MAQDIAVPDGYASGTTGGGDVASITVSTPSEFIAATGHSNPAVIIVSGMLNVGSVTIGSNKTIVGADSTSGLYGGTIRIQGTNYIIQNLKFGPASGDVMEISGATNVFITNCEFHDSSDELCSIVRQSDYVTVSWCKFYFDNSDSHSFAHLIGNGDDVTADRGKLHVTMHHNWYDQGIRGRQPRVRFGHVHIYNNYYNSVGSGYCIGVGYECHIRVENTYFESVSAPWADYGGVSNGEMGWDNLIFVNCSQPTFVSNSFPVFELPYDYEMDAVENVKDIVIANAGNVFRSLLQPPVQFAAELQGFTTVKLTWEDNSEDENGFMIERAEGDTGSFAIIVELPANDTSYVDSLLEELTVYRYRMMAFNDSLESSYSPTIQVITLSPTALPTVVSEPSPADGAKYVDTAPTLKWKASLNADSYDIHFGMDNPPPFVNNQVETIFVPGDLEKGQTYYWRIDGTNANGTTEGPVWSFTVIPDIPAEQVAYWKFDETEGTTASDDKKYGMDGTLMNMDPPLWTTGVAGGALGFDGNDDYILVPQNGVLDFTDQSFSITTYVKIESFPSGSIYLVHKGTFSVDDGPGANGSWFGIELKNGELRFAVDDNVTKSQATLNNVEEIFLNKWVHIAAVRDRANELLKLYVNGEMKASSSDGTGSISQTIDLHLGNCSRLDASLPGVLDELKLFSYALSETEVKAEVLTDFERINETIPDKITLSQNYPNPFNPSTRIEYSIPIRSIVKLEVFDITGKKVTTLVNEVKGAGTHSAYFDASDLSTGIYMCILTTKNHNLTRKMLLIK
jgi:pectate lyase